MELEQIPFEYAVMSSMCLGDAITQRQANWRSRNR
jgi:hypothetical protein